MLKLRPSSSESSVNGRILKLLKGKPLYFSCQIPAQIGFFCNWALRLFYSGIVLGEKQAAVVRELPDDALIIYTNKFKSYFEFLFTHSRSQHLGLKCPQIGFGYRIRLLQPLSRLFRIIFSQIYFFLCNFSLPDPYDSGFMHDELLESGAAFFSLGEKKGLYRRFVKAEQDPVQFLIRLQWEIGKPIYFVPELMFFSKKPSRTTLTLRDMLFGSDIRPGRLRRLWIMFRKPGKVFVEFSRPLNLAEFLQTSASDEKDIEQLAQRVRKELLHRINRHRHSITGPALRAHWERKELILTGEQLGKFITRYAESRHIPLHKVRKKAADYIEEIAAKYNPAFVDVGAAMVKWLSNLMFDGISFEQDEIDHVRAMSQRGPLILIPCHKSHIDYLILSYIFHSNNMPCPHIAAGKNLSFWPMGPIFRAGGAFFIRRTFRGAVLYSQVFAAYIRSLLQDGFNVEFFIEGGRSRTGKLILPKLGLLSILINAFRDGACEDMIFVPIFVGYDQVLEESAYIRELEGGQKEPENLFQVIKARKFLKKRYGRIYIHFNEPMSLQDLLAQRGQSIGEMSSKEQNALIREIGYRVINAINQVSVITPHALVAAVTLNGIHQTFSYQSLMEDLDVCLKYLDAQEAQLADTLVLDPEKAVQTVLESYTQRKLIERVSPDKKTDPSRSSYRVIDSKRSLLEYYKNNCVALFIPAAYTSLAILEKDAFQFSATDLHSGYTFLEEFFKNEFAYDVDKSPEQFVRKTLKTFIDEAILIPHAVLPDTYNLTSSGYRKLKLFACMLETLFESYAVVLAYLGKQSKKAGKARANIKKIQNRGSQLYKRGEIRRPESVSKIYYQNAVDYFHAHGIKSSGDKEKIEYYDQKIRHYLQVLS